MPDTERAQRLLALFTSPESAEGIAGDLTEAHDGGGSSPAFWRNVLATTAALWGSVCSGAPLVTLGLVAAGCALFASSALSGVVVVNLFPGQLGAAAGWIVPSLWWIGALCTGALLVGIAQTRGMAACLVLAMTIEAMLALFAVTVSVPHSDILRTPRLVFYLVAVLAPLPLLTGGVMMRLRLTRNADALEQER